MTMVADITVWMQNFLLTLNESFENRVWFVGLQGSYGRGEATEASDIDVVVILDENAVNRAIKIGACSIFHGCVHNMLYEKSEEILRGLYKSASFVIQAIVFKQTGSYFRHQKELLQVVLPGERIIIDNFVKMKRHETVDFSLMSETLFAWSKKWIADKG